MLRDRLVVSVRDISLSEKLQTDPNLTLECAKTMIRQKEAAREHRRELQDDKKEASVCKVGSGTQSQRRAPGSSGRPQFRRQATAQRSRDNECGRCGKPKHQGSERCPAVGATCHHCHKKGHFSTKCYFKAGPKTTVAALVYDSAEMQAAFLGTLTAGTTQDPWIVDLVVQGHTISFKLDTGAEVTAITEKSYQSLGKPQLSKPSRVLCGPARQPLEVLGQS